MDGRLARLLALLGRIDLYNDPIPTTKAPRHSQENTPHGADSDGGAKALDKVVVDCIERVTKLEGEIKENLKIREQFLTMAKEHAELKQQSLATTREHADLKQQFVIMEKEHAEPKGGFLTKKEHAELKKTVTKLDTEAKIAAIRYKLMESSVTHLEADVDKAANYINKHKFVSRKTLDLDLDKMAEGLRAEFITARNEVSSGQPAPAEPILNQSAVGAPPATRSEVVHGQVQGFTSGRASNGGQQTRAAAYKQAASSTFLGANQISASVAPSFGGGNVASPVSPSRRSLRRPRAQAEDQRDEARPRKRVAGGDNSVNRAGNNN